MSRALQSKNSPRAGVVLVFFALLFVGFLAIAGMAVDLGLARMTQRQMQGATDSVALETLRERDRARSATAETDPYLRDLMRRSLNGRIATWRYTPDLTVGGSGDEEFEGAGAYITLSEGQGELNWGRVIEEVGWTPPRPRTNYESEENEEGGPVSATPLNRRQGDIVSGSFNQTVFGVGGSPFRMETPDYERPDFAPAPADDAPYGESVLVRLRRTAHPYAGGGDDSQPNVSSSGPTIPMLFSAGTAILGGDSGSGESIRHTGFRVRATSIATARKAVRAGVRVQEDVLQAMLGAGQMNEREAALLRVGVTGLALRDRFWNAIEGTIDIWKDRQDGDQQMILEIGELLSARNLLFQHGTTNPNLEFENVVGVLTHIQPRIVADRLPYPPPDDASLVLPAHFSTVEGLVPVYDFRFTNSGGLWMPSLRVIGFGRVRIEHHVDDDTGEPQFGANGLPLIRVVRLGNRLALDLTDPWIAPRNASARFDGTQTDELTPSMWEALMIASRNLRHAVHAPALAR